MPIIVDRASAGATFGMAVKIDAGTRPATVENAIAATYCIDEEHQGENTTSSAVAIPIMPLPISVRAATPRENSQPAPRLPSALASTASALSPPAALGEIPPSCRMDGRKPKGERNWKENEAKIIASSRAPGRRSEARNMPPDCGAGRARNG